VPRRFRLDLIAAVLCAAAGVGCSPRRMAIAGLTDMVGQMRAVYASDADPELIREAMPFTLKVSEALIAGSPRDPEILLLGCSGFTQYTRAFVHPEPELVTPGGYRAAEQQGARARALYLRALSYCLRALELGHPGIGARLRKTPEAAAREIGPDEVPALYWTGASWGGAIALGVDRPELVADYPAVRALLRRALALDEDYDGGAIHEALIFVEGVPEAMGGSAARARHHFERAVALQRGRSAGPYLALATAIALPAQDRAAFERLLGQALAVDPGAAPEIRLANVLAQRRARALLNRADELIPQPAAKLHGGRP
jgi:predicted anti-sigma-YlaC factor YlaD